MPDPRYLFLTGQPVGFAPALPDDLFLPGQRVLVVHGGSAHDTWSASAAAQGALLVRTHLRELDVDTLQKYPPAIILFDLLAAQTVHLPDMETLADTLRQVLPGTQLWADLTGLLTHIPFYTDNWGFTRAFCQLTTGWWMTGTQGEGPLPIAWQELMTDRSLPMAWQAVQHRAKTFRSLLHESGGRLFGGVTTHAFTCFLPPLIGMPPGASSNPAITALSGTGQPGGVFRLMHTEPQDTLIRALEGLWT